jgi:hypothetical protein
MKLKLIEEQGYLYTEDKKWHLPLGNNPILPNLGLLPEIVIEDAVEKLAEKWCLINNYNFEDMVHSNYRDYIRVYQIWVAGYKSATKVYSEEDLKKIREMLVQGAFTDMSCSSAVVEFDKIIQSFKQPKTPKWFVAEMKCGRCYIPLKDDDCWSAKECSRNSKNDLLLTITINGKTYLVGTYLYD